MTKIEWLRRELDAHSSLTAEFDTAEPSRTAERETLAELYKIEYRRQIADHLDAL